MMLRYSGRIIVLSTLLIGAFACKGPASDPLPSSTAGNSSQGSATAWGVGAELQHESDGSLSVEVTSALRRLDQLCFGGACPAESVYQVRPSLLVDFDEVLTGDSYLMAIDNQVGAEEKSVSSFAANLAPGSHCVLAITQFVPKDGERPQAEEAMMAGLYSFQAGSGEEHCRSENLEVLSTEFRPSESFDCGGWALVTLVDNGARVADDVMLLTVPACDFEQVLIQVRDGIIDRACVGVIPATNELGYHVVEAERPESGDFRLVLTQANRPRERDFAHVSPPYEFPAELS